MTRRSKLWWVAAGLFAFINAGGAIYAAAEGEEMHAMSHLFALLVGLAAYVGWRLARRAAREDMPRAQLADERVEYLQQSVDAMALELERMGEAQRYREKLQAARGESPPLNKDQ